jgi:orotidine-5'-phosphate decarboxylase
MTNTFYERIAKAANDKKSAIVLALDAPISIQDLYGFANKIIGAVEQHVCAIKMNFHLILPLSASEILQINTLAHSYGLQSIADIKLNDIENTNEAAVERLIRMGFDGIIANPFIGKSALISLAHKAHEAYAGIIALVYMSHSGANESFGLRIEDNHQPLYEIFQRRAAEADADGIVVGATQLEIIKQMAKRGLPIYSPGIGAQGGDIEKTVNNGADYLIIGRSIIESEQPARVANEIKNRILAVSK